MKNRLVIRNMTFLILIMTYGAAVGEERLGGPAFNSGLIKGLPMKSLIGDSRCEVDAWETAERCVRGARNTYTQQEVWWACVKAMNKAVEACIK
jgi:hypothetical protein